MMALLTLGTNGFAPVSLLHLSADDACRGLCDLELRIAHLGGRLSGEEHHCADRLAVCDDRADDLRRIRLRVLLAGHRHEPRAAATVGRDHLTALNRLLQVAADGLFPQLFARHAACGHDHILVRDARDVSQRPEQRLGVILCKV